MFVFNLTALSYYICLALFVILVLAIGINFRNYSCLFKKIAKKRWILLSLVFISALFVRVYVIPHGHYVFYDEYEHINIAKNLLETEQFFCCDFYLDGKCLASHQPQWMPGYHFLLSLLFGLFGAGESTAYALNIFLGSVSIIILFLAAYLVTQKTSIALVSAFLLAFSPLHLKFSGNSSLEMASFFFILFSFLALLMFAKLQTNKSFFLLVASLAYTVILRPENGLILLPFALFLILKNINWKALIKLSYLAVLFIPYFVYLPYIKEYQIDNWLIPHLQVSTVALLMANLGFWLSNDGVPVIYVLMAIIAVCYALTKKEKIYLWFAVYFFIFLFFYSFVHKLRISEVGHQRFCLQFYFPIVILASIGIHKAYQFINKYVKKESIVLAILFSLITFNIAQSFPYVYSRNESRIYQRQYEMLLEGQEIDDNCVFITYNPSSVITTIGKSSVGISYVFDNSYNPCLKNRCLILVDDYWCNEDSNGLCSLLKNRYTLERLESESNYDLKLFYRLKPKQ